MVRRDNVTPSNPEGSDSEVMPCSSDSVCADNEPGSEPNKLNLSLKAISECNNALIHAVDEVDLLYQVCRIITDTCGYKLAWVGYAMHDDDKSVLPVAQVGFDDGYLDQARITWDGSDRGRGPTGTAIRTGKPCLARDILTDPSFSPWRAEAIKRGYAASIVLPLLIDGQIIGALSIYSSRSDAFDSEEMVLLTELAKFLSFGIAAIRSRVQQAESQLAMRLSEERLRMLGDNLPDSYVYQYDYRADGTPRFLYISAGIQPLHGVSADDALHDASLLFNQIKPEQIPAFLSAEEHSMESMTDFEMDMEMQRSDGQWRWFRLRSRPRREASGHVVWDGVATDITERKQAEEVKLALERRLEDIIEFLPDATFIIDQHSQVIAWNRACESLTGVSKLDMVGKSNGEYSVPFLGDRLPLLIDMVDQPEAITENPYLYLSCKDGIIIAEEFNYYLQNGRGLYLIITAAPLYDRNGQRCGAIESVRDITERREAEVALRESERKYRELVENANSIILRWTSDGRISYLNEYGQRFFGYTESEIIGQHVLGTIVPATDSSGHDLRVLMEHICANPYAFEQNVNENIRRNGERVWIAWTNKIVIDQAGQINEIMSIGLDITERKRMEEDLRHIQANLESIVTERTAQLAEALHDAQAADRIKSAFLATMSHELRTPLNSIIGFTGLLLQGLAGPLNAEQAKQLSMVKSSGQHLLDLINDVLDISKIEAGQTDLAFAPFDLKESILQVVRTMTPQADNKRLPIVTEIADEIGQFNGDKRRVEQVMLNLLSNAVKFTERGQVTVSAKKCAHEYHLAVTDTGPGIKPEDMDKLFLPFRQLDSGLSRQFEGTGLGLAICKRLVEKMDGDITVQTIPGVGSTFEIILKDNLGDKS